MIGVNIRLTFGHCATYSNEAMIAGRKSEEEEKNKMFKEKKE